MDNLFDAKIYLSLLDKAQNWVVSNVFVLQNVTDVLLQVLILIAVRLLGLLLGRWIRRTFFLRLMHHFERHRYVASFANRFVELLPLLVSIFILWASLRALQGSGLRTFLLSLTLNLSAAWLAIELATSVISDRFWARLVSVSAWTLAALNILGLMDESIKLLEGIGLSVGDVHLTLLSLIKACILLLLLLRLVFWLSSHLEKRLNKVKELTPSTRLMIAKGMHIALLFIVILVALNSVGIDLTALAFFSGAVGFGVGFGLQKVVANFISGVILLSDKSIKPGDVIEHGGVYGWVNRMGGRCVSVITRDEKEFLIPNESLIVNPVVNWSYSSKNIRVKADIGISYNADPHRAIELITGCLEGMRRVLKSPAPKCLVMGFGDSSVNLQLRFWIKDPQNGVANITSEVLLKVWDTLKANQIEIPFPQLDLHVKRQPDEIPG